MAFKTNTMKNHKILPGVLKISSILLIFLAYFSCTYDYFEDETNFELHVPQIVNGEITNFYVAIHKENGDHLVTRRYVYPFDQNERLRQGIIKFKLPRGNVRVTCFANYSDSLLTEGVPFNQSRKEQYAIPGEPDLYRATSSDPLAFLLDTVIFPIGHPQAKIPIVANMDASKKIKGRIICNFIGLPPDVTDLDIFYSGDASRYSFDGIFESSSAHDRFLSSPSTFAHRFDVDGDGLEDVSYVQNIYPSAGVSFQKRNPVYTDNGEEIALEIVFYDSAHYEIGRAGFRSSDIPNIPLANRPVDENGNVLTSLVLYPQHTITFTFKGFQIFKIDLAGWGDIETGPTSPM